MRDRELLAGAVGLSALGDFLGFIPLARAERDGNEQLRAAEWELRSG